MGAGRAGEPRRPTSSRSAGTATEGRQPALWRSFRTTAPNGLPVQLAISSATDRHSRRPARADAGDRRGLVDRYYTPGRAILVLAGGFAPDTARAEIERHLGPLRQSDDRRTADDRPEENGTAERRVVESRVPAARAHHGQRVEGHAQPGWYRAALAVSSLALGRSSPLQRELVAEREVAQRVDSTIISMRDASTIVFSATAAEGVEHRQLEDALDDSVDRLLRRGVSAEMLHRARRRQLAGHYLRVQRLNHRADLCARLTSYFDAPERFTSEDRRLLGVTVDDLGSYTADLARVPRASLSIVPAGEQP